MIYYDKISSSSLALEYPRSQCIIQGRVNSMDLHQRPSGTSVNLTSLQPIFKAAYDQRFIAEMVDPDVAVDITVSPNCTIGYKQVDGTLDVSKSVREQASLIVVLGIIPAFIMLAVIISCLFRRYSNGTDTVDDDIEDPTSKSPGSSYKQAETHSSGYRYSFSDFLSFPKYYRMDASHTQGVRINV